MQLFGCCHFARSEKLMMPQWDSAWLQLRGKLRAAASFCAACSASWGGSQSVMNLLPQTHKQPQLHLLLGQCLQALQRGRQSPLVLLRLPHLLRPQSVLRLRVLLLSSWCFLGLRLGLLHRLLLLMLALGLEVGTVLLERLVLWELGPGHLGVGQHVGLRQLGARLLRRVA